jgi:hypothetical protein
MGNPRDLKTREAKVANQPRSFFGSRNCIYVWLALLVQEIRLVDAVSCAAGEQALPGCVSTRRLDETDVSLTTDAPYWTGNTAGLLSGPGTADFANQALHFDSHMGEVTIESLNNPIGALGQSCCSLVI